MIKDTVFLYLLFSSAVLIYGTGLKRIIVYSHKPKNILFIMIRMLITSILSVIVCRGISIVFLIPARLQELFPFVCVIFTCLFALITEKLCEQFLHTEAKEISISLCSVIIAVNEGLTMSHTILIVTTCIMSFFIILPILYAIRQRLNYSQQEIDFKNGALLFLSFALILLVFFSLNVSSLHLGAL